MSFCDKIADSNEVNMSVVEIIKKKLLIRYPFFGSITANVNFVENNERPTTDTDGENIYYNSSYIFSLSKKEQLFVFAHESCHIAFNHVFRSEGKDRETWNMATDAVINAFLEKDGLVAVENAFFIEDAIQYDAEELYELLLDDSGQQNSEDEKNDQDNQNNMNEENSAEASQNQQDEQENDQGQDDESDSQNSESQEQQDNQQESENEQNGGQQTHSMWEDAVNKNKKQQSQTPQRSEKDTFNENAERREQELDELMESLSQELAGAGSTTESIERQVDGIGFSKPVIDWRYFLKEAVNLDIDWSYAHADIEEGVVTPHLEDIIMPETEIVLDTSQSVSDVLLKNFLRECKNILQTSKVKVGCFDTQFYGFTEIRNESDIEKMEFVGDGGTNFNAAVNAFSNRVENKIIFTDGEAAIPDKEMDVIWIVFGQRKIEPKGGKVIYISQKGLRRLTQADNKPKQEEIKIS